MNGKISLILVMLFSVIFALFGRNMLISSNLTVDNFSFYFSKTQANQIARSGVYIGLANLNSIDPNWTSGNYDISDGTAKVSFQSTGGVNGLKRIVSIGIYGTSDYLVSDTVIATLRQLPFSSYGNYYNNFALANGSKVWAATGDVFDGRFHANDFIRCYGNPRFTGEVTTSRKIQIYDSKSHPIFDRGYKESTLAEIPTIDMASMNTAADNGKKFYDTTGANRFTNVYLKFYSDSTVEYKSKIGSGSWSPLKRVPITTLTNNGLILIKGGSVSVEGVVNGQVTVAAVKSGSTNASAGTVIIQNSITYAVDPMLDYTKHNPPYACDDVLGLVAEKEVLVPYDASRHGININASIFAQDGGMRIEKYSYYGAAYDMNIVGGVIGNYVEPTADYQWSSSLGMYIPVRGYRYVHRFDSRFNNWTPPFFPARRMYTPLQWYSGIVRIPVFS